MYLLRTYEGHPNKSRDPQLRRFRTEDPFVGASHNFHPGLGHLPSEDCPLLFAPPLRVVALFSPAKSEYYLSDHDSHHLVSAVALHFCAHHPDIRLCEIIITMQNFIYVIIDSTSNPDAVAYLLPGTIANCPAGYLHEDKMHRPRRQDRKATRDIRPNPILGASDTTPYGTLCPGVMVWSDQQHSHSPPYTVPV